MQLGETTRIETLRRETFLSIQGAAVPRGWGKTLLFFSLTSHWLAPDVVQLQIWRVTGWRTEKGSSREPETTKKMMERGAQKSNTIMLFINSLSKHGSNPD